jgi:hypothetical protein
LWPSDLASILQYGCGPSPDFLAKILCVDTEMFLCDTQFYFPASSSSRTQDRPVIYVNWRRINPLFVATILKGRDSLSVVSLFSPGWYMSWMWSMVGMVLTGRKQWTQRHFNFSLVFYLECRNIMTFQFLTALNMLKMAFCVLTQCGLLSRYQRFGETYCLFPQIHAALLHSRPTSMS